MKKSAKKDFNRIQSTGLSPFLRAVEQGYADKVETMIYTGADVNTKTKHATRMAKIWYEIPHAVGSTALHLAASNGDLKIIQLLIQARADINAQNNLRRTPLDNALLALRHFEKILKSRENKTFKRKKKIREATEIVDEYKDVIQFMIKHGAKTGMLHMPNDLTPQNKL